jgi:hypothetical protein
VLAAEHLLDLAALDQPGELLDSLGEICAYVFPLGGPVDQDANVICLGLELRYQLNFLLDTAASLERLLRLYLVVPEAGRRGARFYLGKLVARACGFKDNSGDRRRVSRGPDNGG